MSSYLKSDIGIKASVYPFDDAVILEFEFSDAFSNNDIFHTKSTSVLEAIRRAKLDEFPFSNNVVFKGTNYYLVDKKVYLIKDESSSQWTEEQVYIDIQRIINP